MSGKHKRNRGGASPITLGGDNAGANAGRVINGIPRKLNPRFKIDNPADKICA